MSKLTYGQICAIKRTKAMRERKNSSKNKKVKLAKPTKQPKLTWFPLENYKYKHTQDNIVWDDNERASKELAYRLEHNDSNLQILTLGTGCGKTSITVSALGILNKPCIVIASPNIINSNGWLETICAYNNTHNKDIDLYMSTTFDKFTRILSDARSKSEFINRFPSGGVIVIDEIHNYKTPTSKRSKRLQSLCSYPIIGLTATPLTNDVVMDECSYLILGGYYTSKNNFLVKNNLTRFIDEYNRLAVYNPTTHMVDERIFPAYYTKIRDEISDIIYRPEVKIDKSEFPTLETHVVQLPYDDSLEADLRSIAEANNNRMFASESDVRFSIESRILTDENRVNKCYELICRKDVVQPLIFFVHLTARDALINMFDDKGVSYQLIDGSTSISDVDTNEDTPILIQYQSGAEGIEFKISNTSIFYENQWRYVMLEQAIGRNMRRGCTHKVNHYMIVSSATYDQKIFDFSQSKTILNESELDAIAINSLPTI